MDWVEPNVCTDEHLGIDDGGQLRLHRWSVPRLVADVKAESGGDGTLTPTVTLPGKLLIDIPDLGWVNDGPVDVMMLIRVVRSYRSWIVSNPNAIQVRDRWTWAIDRTPAVPLTTGVYNSQTGSAIDLGTNSVAEPNPGRQWVWSGATCSDEWVGPVSPGQRLNVRYRCYVWTPPPWSDNANKNRPQHEAAARWARVSLMAFPQQGKVVVG